MANSPILEIPLLAVSQAAKETTINTMVSYLERSMNDTITINMAGSDYLCPATDLKRYFCFKLTSAGVGSEFIISAMKRMFIIDNTANAVDVTVVCSPASLTIPAGAVVIAMVTTTPTLIRLADTTITGGGSGVTNFIGLSDTFPAYTGLGKFVLRVKEDLTGIEAVELGISDMADVDVTGIADDYILMWDAGDSKFKAVAIPPSDGGPAMVATPVRAATTANIDIVDLFPGAELDGVTLDEDDRVLLKDQSDPIENGVYVIGATDAARATEMDDLAEIPQGYEVFVLEGDVNGQSLWVLATENVSVGSSFLTFVKPKAGVFEDLLDYDSGVVAADNMILVFNETSGKWTPTVNSSSLPAGGTTGQALVKNSSTDFDWGFKTLIPAGGTAGQIVRKVDGTDYNMAWVDMPTPQWSVRTVTGTADTPVLADAQGFIIGDNASDIAFTIPPNSSVAYPIGTTLTFVQKNIGKCMIQPGAGVLIETAATFLNQSAEQWAQVSVVQISANVWALTGHLEVA